MKTITEAEAQQLANLLGMPVTQDRNGCRAWVTPTRCGISRWKGDFYREIPIRIDSDRPWTEQIWGPE